VVIPPAPDWSGSVHIALEGGDLCVCDGVSNTPLSSSGTPGQSFRFQEHLAGSGDLAGETWAVEASVAASTPGADQDGTMKVTVTMTGPDGTVYKIEGQANMAPVPSDHSDGIWAWQLVGTWSLPNLGWSGNIDGLFSWWSSSGNDNRPDQPVGSTLSLTQAS